MKLSNKLENLNSYPFHMPGHKRNAEFNIIGAEIDITEIDGFDNLHNPCGMIADMEKDLSEIYGYKKSIISVNGSTCGILSAVSAVCSKRDKIIIARNCHKSVYNACFINELDVKYIEHEYDSTFGVYTYISQKSVDEAIKKNPDACAVIITSPTYEGFISNIKCDIPLIIDSAHGAHFGINEKFPAKQNGDIIIQSLHKTLPALTQTAVVHINNEKYADRVKMYMDIFESSSPSYILLASIDKCIDFLKSSEMKYNRYFDMLEDFYEFTETLRNIKILSNDDKSRIVLMSESISGSVFADILRTKYRIEAEASTINYVILISTVCDTEKGFNQLKQALKDIDQISGNFTPFTEKTEIPEKILNSCTVNRKKAHGFSESAGRVSAEYIFAYPPGVPILVPGELITDKIIKTITKHMESGVNIISDSGLLPRQILVY